MLYKPAGTFSLTGFATGTNVVELDPSVNALFSPSRVPSSSTQLPGICAGCSEMADANAAAGSADAASPTTACFVGDTSRLLVPRLGSCFCDIGLLETTAVPGPGLPWILETSSSMSSARISSLSALLFSFSPAPPSPSPFFESLSDRSSFSHWPGRALVRVMVTHVGLQSILVLDGFAAAQRFRAINGGSSG